MTQQTSGRAPEYKVYLAWDVPMRWLHWINALAVLGLIASGLVILNDDTLGVSSAGKILLKSIRVSFGYAIAVKLLWRLIWAFYSNRYSRWQGILPGGPGYLAPLRAYAASFLSGEPQQFVEHNPLARIGIALHLGLLLIQLTTASSRIPAVFGRQTVTCAPSSRRSLSHPPLAATAS